MHGKLGGIGIKKELYQAAFIIHNSFLFTAKARTGSSRKPDFWEILEFSINLLKSRINQKRIKKVRGWPRFEPRLDGSVVGALTTELSCELKD